MVATVSTAWRPGLIPEAVGVYLRHGWYADAAALGLCRLARWDTTLVRVYEQWGRAAESHNFPYLVRQPRVHVTFYVARVCLKVEREGGAG